MAYTPSTDIISSVDGRLNMYVGTSTTFVAGDLVGECNDYTGMEKSYEVKTRNAHAYEAEQKSLGKKTYGDDTLKAFYTKEQFDRLSGLFEAGEPVYVGIQDTDDSTTPQFYGIKGLISKIAKEATLGEDAQISITISVLAPATVTFPQ